MTAMKVDTLEEETARMIERVVVLRISTKHINLWMRQLEMKRNEVSQLSGLMGFGEVEKEIETEESRKMSQKMHQPLHKEGEKDDVRADQQYGVE